MINRELIRLKVVQLVYAHYHNDGKTKEAEEKELNHSLNKAYDLYKYLLNLLIEIRLYSEKKYDASLAKNNRLGGSEEIDIKAQRLANNKFLLQLNGNFELAIYREKKVDWNEEINLIKDLYNLFIKSELFNTYFIQEDFSYNSDREIIRKLYKSFICHNNQFEELLEDHSIYWNDDKHIVDSFVLKTIKKFNPEFGYEQNLLPEYSVDEDKDFAKKLYFSSIEHDHYIRKIIEENIKNWEFNRLAFMDIILMQIALTEILYFPQIPLNVTFNEYLNIANIYSTPKSSSYIHGLLDNVVKLLQTEKIIFK